MSCALMVLLHVRLGVSAAPLMEDAYPPELSTAIPRDVYIILQNSVLLTRAPSSSVRIRMHGKPWRCMQLKK